MALDDSTPVGAPKYPAPASPIFARGAASTGKSAPSSAPPSTAMDRKPPFAKKASSMKRAKKAQRAASAKKAMRK